MTDSIQDLADAIGAAVGDLSDEERAIYVGLYELLTEGEPVTPAMLATRTGLDVELIERTLTSMVGLFRDDERASLASAALLYPRWTTSSKPRAASRSMRGARSIRSLSFLRWGDPPGLSPWTR